MGNNGFNLYCNGSGCARNVLVNRASGEIIMTQQEAYDTAVAKMREQKYVPSFDGEACRYRHKGLVCAVGALLPDDEYLEDYDTNADAPFSIPYIQNLIAFPKVYAMRSFWYLFQGKLHDLNVYADGDQTFWEENFIDFAEHFNLKYEEPK